MEWLPIESAPKNEGVPILAWESGHPYIAEWDDDQWWTDDDRYNDYERKFPPGCSPTYWMPLPDPPLTHPVDDGGG